MSLPDWLYLQVVVTLAFVVEAVTGFGATVLAVALGSFVLPVGELVPAFVPVNLLLSIAVALRDRGHVEARLLTTRVLPAMVLGIPVGFYLFGLMGRATGAAEACFGLFVVVLGSSRLFGLWRRRPSVPLSRFAEGATLGAAGVVHGAFGTGGPLVIVALSRLGLPKSTFRATLATLWLVLSVPLLVGFAVQGRLGMESLHRSLALLPALVVGLVTGQVLHHRIRPDTFVASVYVLLTVAGMFLAARAMP